LSNICVTASLPTCIPDSVQDSNLIEPETMQGRELVLSGLGEEEFGIEYIDFRHEFDSVARNETF
jgi:hypothetical protein